MTVTGSDVPQGQEVRWYAGGEQTSETITVDTTSASDGYITLIETAEYGSVIIRVNGEVTECEELQADGTTAATETDGTETVSYTGIAESDVVEAYYLAIGTTPLVQVAACTDVKTTITADTKSASVHGQSNKLKSVGAIEQDAELEEFHYNQDFISKCLGDQVTGTAMTKLTTRYSGMKKIGCMVGKRRNSDGEITYKWFMYGAQITEVGKEFPTEDFYKDSMKIALDDYLEVDLT